MPHDVLIGEIESWLLDETLGSPDIVTLFDALCARLNGAGLPLDRAAVSWPTLHPLFTAEQIFWRRETGAELFQYLHDNGMSASYLASPFNLAHKVGLTRLRRRLIGPEAQLDFDVLVDLHGQGFTDYLLTATKMSIARVKSYAGGEVGLMASWATRRENGFSDADIVALSRIQKVFAVACHASIQMRISEALAGTYLGPHAAAHVMAGDTKLGDGERIRAVVWFSDLRCSTFLSGIVPPEEFLDYLTEYYACTAEPVIEAGGDIIDFIGDAVLAVFPVKGDLGGPDAARSAGQAMAQAIDRLEAYRARSDAPEMQFSIALAMGEIMFGNIGVPSRLSFSAIGEVVNKVSRIDQMTKTLGRAVLATDEVAQHDPARWAPLGSYPMDELNRTIRLHAPKDLRDRFDNEALRERLRRQVLARAG
ncbi:MAG: adenylate/guanylate cyclase domain-containing protein [Pseudomonadota bacterium]